MDEIPTLRRCGSCGQSKPRADFNCHAVVTYERAGRDWRSRAMGMVAKGDDIDDGELP